MLELKTRTMTRTVQAESGLTILDVALQHKVDWGFSCSRGTCAKCRCYITEGREHLVPATQAESNRLEPEELEQGFRLGCQAKLLGSGVVRTIHKPYF